MSQRYSDWAVTQKSRVQREGREKVTHQGGDHRAICQPSYLLGLFLGSFSLSGWLRLGRKDFHRSELWGGGGVGLQGSYRWQHHGCRHCQAGVPFLRS